MLKCSLFFMISDDSTLSASKVQGRKESVVNFVFCLLFSDSHLECSRSQISKAWSIIYAKWLCSYEKLLWVGLLQYARSDRILGNENRLMLFHLLLYMLFTKLLSPLHREANMYHRPIKRKHVKVQVRMMYPWYSLAKCLLTAVI